MVLTNKKQFKVINLIFLIALSILFIFGVLINRNINNLNASQRKIQNTYEIKLLLERLNYEITYSESNVRGYFITKRPVFYERYLAGKANTQSLYFDLLVKTKDNERQSKILHDFNTVIKQRFAIMEDRINYINNYEGSFPEEFKLKLDTARISMDLVTSGMNSLISNEDLLMLERYKYHNKVSTYTPYINSLIIIFCFLLLLGAFLYITKNTKDLDALADSLIINNESFEHAEEIAKLTHWEMKIPENKITFSKSAKNVLRYADIDENGYVLDIEKYLSIVHPEDREIVNNYLLEIEKKKNASRNITFRIIHEGDVISYLRSSYMLYQDDKERTIVLGINQDISEKILYQQGLEKNNEELIKYNKELSSFNYVVSHDLQEPLRKIRMFVSRIKDDPNNHLSEKSIGFFEKVQDSSMRMQNLIDDLLAYSRINRSDLKKEQVDLNSILEQVIQDWAHIIEDRRVMLSYDKLPIVNGYIFQLHQLFSNIIGNALKYSKPDIPPNIHISHSIKEGADIKFPIIEKLAQYHEIKVSDNGIGFESKYAEEIFGLFKRQHNKDSYKGTGIGLAICRKIVEQHHGYIFAEGVRDIGAAFYIYLPYESSSPAS